MTTTVTVKTHSWPVDVTTTTSYPGSRSHVIKPVTVEPESHRDFYVSDSVTITLQELPLPANPGSSPRAA